MTSRIGCQQLTKLKVDTVCCMLFSEHAGTAWDLRNLRSLHLRVTSKFTLDATSNFLCTDDIFPDHHLMHFLVKLNYSHFDWISAAEICQIKFRHLL